MPINPSIAMGFQAPQFESPMNAMAKMIQLRQAEQQNQLGTMKMDEYQRGIGEQNRLRSTLSGLTGDTESQVQALTKAGFLKQARELAESHAKASKDTREGDKAAADLAAAKTKQLRDMLPSVTDQASYDAWRALSIKELPQAASMIPPQFSPDAVQRLMLTADQALEKHFVTRDGGASGDTIAINKYGPGGATVVPGSQFNKTMTPGEAARLPILQQTANAATANARTAASRLTQETATGNWSPESIEFAANQYVQTGIMPSVGFGKAAIAIRDSIIKRASQIASGAGAPVAPGAEPATPLTPGEASAKVVANKQNVAAQASTMRDFSSGVSARRVAANNTAINHLDTMEKLAADLDNADIRVFNSAANAFARTTGAPAPTNFDAAKQLVASEVIKAVVNNGGGVTERQEAAEQFSRANSPKQLAGVIKTYKELLAGQLDSLGLQYETGTGRKDFDKKLTPATAKVFKSMRGGAPAPAAPAKATAAGATVSNW